MGWWGQREGSNYAFDVRLISVLKLYFSVNVILVMGCRAGEMDCKLGEGGHGTLKGIVGNYGWLTRRIFKF